MNIFDSYIILDKSSTKSALQQREQSSQTECFLQIRVWTGLVEKAKESDYKIREEGYQVGQLIFIVQMYIKGDELSEW